MTNSISPTSSFRPCIDIHQGLVKQIIGSTLHHPEHFDSPSIHENYVSKKSAVEYADIYFSLQLSGGHVIMLDRDNDTIEASKKVLDKYPHFFQVGGGMNKEQSKQWLDYGAAKIIISSYCFPQGKFSLPLLQELSKQIGKERLVMDLSCIKKNKCYYVAIHGWKTVTDFELSHKHLNIHPYM